ncbi:TPR domain-containing glycosyltransferase [Cohnella sp. REN36]|uniref:TPR domain-containing glycosyltransferase n=1 Tax=Cohnella sp. REN36 TaxID=2887347 RepID=UPI001D138B63|nr:TPR domain-containing glycosyltransferase [Cohnella sp. REN36]MCC3374067.1 glycosyltransferase [Cohnella sp. REN36]
MTPFISLCMIVKNEAATLARCLMSVSGFVDEIVILDTGSNDETKEIAASFTPHVFDFTWVQDFAAARNASTAKATGQWILVLDADEYLESTDQAEALRSYLHSLDSSKPTGIVLPIFNFVGHASSGKISQSQAIRLFNRHSNLRFERPIHEQLASSSGPLVQLEYDLPIYHAGYTSEMIESKQKSERNEAIFRELRAQGKFTPYDSFTLGNEYLMQDRYEEALSCYLAADQPSERDKTWLPQCYANIIACHLKQHAYTDAYSRIEHAIKSWEHACDFYWFKGHLLSLLGLDEEAISALRTCLQKADSASRQPTWLISPNYGSTLPLQQLASLYLRRFANGEAVNVLTKLCYVNPNLQSALIELLKLTAPSEPEDRLAPFIEKLYPHPEGHQTSMLLDACAQLGLRGLAAKYWDAGALKSPSTPRIARLRYALLQADWSLFNQSLSTVTETEALKEAENAILYAASFVWPEQSDLLRGYLTPDSIGNPKLLADACMILYRLQRFEDYDQLIQSHPEQTTALANLLGDALFEDRQFELAFDYYSAALDQNTLSAKGLEHIGRLYIHQGDIENAIPFLENAILLAPDRIPLYMLALIHNRSSDAQLAVRDQLLQHFPGLRGFTLLPL